MIAQCCQREVLQHVVCCDADTVTLLFSLRGSAVFIKALLGKLYLCGDRRRRTRLPLFSWIHRGRLPAEERTVFSKQVTLIPVKAETVSSVNVCAVKK